MNLDGEEGGNEETVRLKDGRARVYIYINIFEHFSLSFSLKVPVFTGWIKTNGPFFFSERNGENTF